MRATAIGNNLDGRAVQSCVLDAAKGHDVQVSAERVSNDPRLHQNLKFMCRRTDSQKNS
jgi:hypothetical protein